jgi:hypothetical protein
MPKFNKPPPDQRGAHARLYWEILDSNAWRCLSASDQRAYVALLRHLRSTNNGDLSLPLSEAKKWGIKSPATLAKSLRALAAVGLIAITRRGGCTKGGQRLPNLYRLTDYQAYENPAKFIDASKATNEWKKITTLGMGRAAIRDAEAIAKQEAMKKTLVQKLAVTTSKNEVVEALTTSKNEVWTDTPPQKLKLAKTANCLGNPIPERVSS